MYVLKFGGTSVGSVQAIKTLVDIVKTAESDGQHPLVVCSAMGGVTNQLLVLGEVALRGESFIDELRNIEGRHQEVVRALLHTAQQNAALIAIKVHVNELEEMLYGVKALGELSASVSDKLVAFGELLSNQLVAFLLHQEVGKATFGDARKLVLTDSQFGKANLVEAETYERIRHWHANLGDSIGVVTGFIGADQQGRTTTLGRGGSDYTAAILGAALQAEEVQIWTDVDGFMTADPRVVKNAYSLDQLTYEEAMELSYFGAKVIYPPTMLPAIGRQIPIRIKNTFNPNHNGTLIGNRPSETASLIKGIASVSDIHLINVQGSGIIGVKGFSGRLFTALANAGVNIMLITQASSEHSISFAVSPQEAAKAKEAIEAAFEYQISQGRLHEPQIMTDLGILAVVGENMRHTRGLSGKLFSTLGRSGINVVAIAQGSSELNISVVMSKADLPKALVAVHDSLFLSPVNTINVFCVGTGKIGAELLDQIHRASAKLAADHHLSIKVRGISNSRKMLLSEDGLDLSNWRMQLENDGQKADTQTYLDAAIALNLPNTALVDNTSTRAFIPHYESLFKENVSVITCNKIGNSERYEQYQLFRDLALRNTVVYHYETTVGAALPIIRTLNDLLVSGDRILQIEAILSGTISFIFNNFKGERKFVDVVRQAQAEGYTEPDPRDDLNGLDFSRKMLILAREMGLKLEISDVQIEPILPQTCLAAPTIEAFYAELEASDAHFEGLKHSATAQNKALRYIGILEQGKMRISLQYVDSNHAFYSLTGSDNIIAFTTERYHTDPLVVKGPGAGIQVTAAGVFADIVRIAKA